MSILTVLNVPKAAEYAVAETLRAYAELGTDVVLRTWQNLQSDNSWDSTKDRTFPVVDIRFTAPRHNEDQHTMESHGQILCGTMTDDDRNHQAVAKLYSGVQGLLDELFFQFISNTESDELTAFKAVLAREMPSEFSFGGLSYGEPLPPFDDAGINMIGINFILHFARTGY